MYKLDDTWIKLSEIRDYYFLFMMRTQEERSLTGFIKFVKSYQKVNPNTKIVNI
jgi:hypothetical protein